MTSINPHKSLKLVVRGDHPYNILIHDYFLHNTYVCIRFWGYYQRLAVFIDYFSLPNTVNLWQVLSV